MYKIHVVVNIFLSSLHKQRERKETLADISKTFMDSDYGVDVADGAPHTDKRYTHVISSSPHHPISSPQIINIPPPPQAPPPPIPVQASTSSRANIDSSVYTTHAPEAKPFVPKPPSPPPVPPPSVSSVPPGM